MFKLQSRDKELLLTLLAVAGTFGLMLLAMYLLGELHGLIATVIGLIVQIVFLNRRVITLERELRISRAAPESPKAGGKAVLS